MRSPADKQDGLSLPEAFLGVIAEFDGQEVLTSLERTYESTRLCSSRLEGCTSFSFSDATRLEGLLAEDADLGARVFWSEMNQLFVAATRTFCYSFQKLSEGMIAGIGSRNELTSALTIRAYLEHACALDGVVLKYLLPRQEEIVTRIWPEWARGRPGPKPTDEHRNLRRELIRYLAGYRVKVNSADMPGLTDSNSAWKKFRGAYSDATPEELLAWSPMTGIQATAGLPGYRHMVLIYELLCEFVHPNSEARNADFFAASTDLRAHVLEIVPTESSGRGFRRVFEIGKEAIARACERVWAALDVLTACTLPISPTPGLTPGEPPPVGSIQVRDVHGQRFWVAPQRIVPDPKRQRRELTEGQRERTARLAERFQDVYPQSLAQWCDRFAYNPDPEVEIREFEDMAAVFTLEVSERPGLSIPERRLVFQALLCAGYCSTVGELLSMRPQLKALRDIERVFERIQSRHAARLGT